MLPLIKVKGSVGVTPFQRLNNYKSTTEKTGMVAAVQRVGKNRPFSKQVFLTI